jgi:chromosome segregation ATPase
MYKQQIVNKVNEIENQLESINESLLKMSVNKFGAIGDFKMLAIHKNSMKYEKEKLIIKKNSLSQEVLKYDKIISDFQKEIEKYSYLLKQEKKQKLKDLEKYDENIAQEYIQAKFIVNKRSDSFV